MVLNRFSNSLKNYFKHKIKYMTFIKLSTTVINSSTISSIYQSNNKYHISSMSGYHFIIAGSGWGMISSSENKYVKEDYIIMTNWIDTQTFK